MEGWTVHRGQGLWRANRSAPEIAGEVLVAIHPREPAVVQFAKPPFNLVAARVAASAWEVEFPAEQKHYRGGGDPPHRLIWPFIPAIIEGGPRPKNWTVFESAKGHWQFENIKTGERLQLILSER